MVRLAALAAGLSGCYAPPLHDCTVSCAGPGECATGQVCGSDHLCAAPGVAGSCGVMLGDAGVGDAESADARPPDGARPDAALHVMVHLHVDGKGAIVIGSGGSCDDDCMISLLLGVPDTLHAVPQAEATFDKWTGGPCDHQAELCAFTPTMNLDIHARFNGG